MVSPSGRGDVCGGWGCLAVMVVQVVWLVSSRPPRAYPARIAALARAPFATRKGRKSAPAWVCSCVGLPSPLPQRGDGKLVVDGVVYGVVLN